MERSILITRDHQFQRGKFKLDSFQPFDSDSIAGDPKNKTKIKLLFSLFNVPCLESTYCVYFYLQENSNLLGKTEFRSGSPILFFSRSFDFQFPRMENEPIFIEIEESLNFKIYKKYLIETNLNQILSNKKRIIIFPLDDSIVKNGDSMCSDIINNSSELNILKDSDLLELKIDTFEFVDNYQDYELNIQISEKEKETMHNVDLCFFVLYNKLDGLNFRPLYKSEEIDASIMNFDRVRLTTRDICLNDLEKEIKIELYRKEFEENCERTKIGQRVDKIKNLINNSKENNISIFLSLENTEESSNSSSFKNQSQISEKENDILNLLKKNNLIMNLIIAIDFTASNGDPSNERSKHFRYGQNPYKKAIRSVGSLLEKCDNDKKFPAYIFGAYINSTKEISHCYNLNRNPSNPYIEGIENVIDNYNEIFDHVTLSGGTSFSGFLKRVLDDLKTEEEDHSQTSINYHVLLILTDGNLDNIDMQKTKDLIVELCNYPISIVIVGIGHFSFEKMKILDADEESLEDSHGRKARDIIQFVNFYEIQQDEEKLKEAVFEEIPTQIEEYLINSET